MSLLEKFPFCMIPFKRVMHLTETNQRKETFGGLKFCLEAVKFCLSQNIDCAINEELGQSRTVDKI